MAIFEKIFCGDFDKILEKAEKAVMNRSISVQLKDKVDYCTKQGRCSIRVFERYSFFDGRRVSMNMTLFQAGDEIFLCVVTAGGASGVFSLDESTWGEKAFLETLEDAL